MAIELLPSKNTLIECMDLATTPEAAAYLTEQFEALLAKRKLSGKFQPLVEKFQAFAAEVESGFDSAVDPWRGEQPLSPYANASEQRVRAAEQNLPTTPVDNVAIGIEFGPEGELNRGYMINNEPADEQTIQRLDVSFHAWFAKQGLLFSAPFIYHATASGKIKTGSDGQQLRVNLDEFKQRVEAEKSGLESYFNTHARGVNVNFVKVNVPDASLEPDAAPAA